MAQTQLVRKAKVSGSDVAVKPRKNSGSSELATRVLNSIGECAYEWDIAKDELIWSDGATQLLCVADPRRINTNRSFNELLLPTTELSREAAIMSAGDQDNGEGVSYRLQYALSAKELGTNSDIWIEDCGRWYAGKDGQPASAHGLLRIINERRSHEERLDRLSKFDPLTGLHNRSHLNLCLDAIIQEISQTGEPAGFLVIGLEHYELINSVHGYEAGDQVIVEIARRMKQNLRENDIIGRFSGAKIGVILPECNDHDMLVAGYRILNILRENVIRTEKGPIAISLSIGGVVIPHQARNSREVFLAAQQALLESRRSRDGAIVNYRHDPEKEAARRQDAQTAERIVTALNEGHINLAFQPIIDSVTGEPEFHEALVRLKAPDGTEMNAGDFVSIAQRLGLIRLVDHHALDLAIDVLIKAPTARFSLNVSNETSCDPEWLSKLALAVQQDPTIPSRLIVEITESDAAETLQDAERFITSLKDIGCQVALDDFGAGFTSFRNLKSLPFDIIKVDGQFACDLHNNAENQTFIRALTDLAGLFGAKIVVEWVEDQETAELLAEWGVDYLQGFAFGQPSNELPWPTVDQESAA